MSEYLVPFGYGEAELIEKKSRFTGRVWLCESEEEALAHLSDMRSKFWDATHNVYAYSIRDEGVTRFSDDGEPQGTAGMPVLDVFRREGIQNFLCVVTRYFGGTLLGAGGLVRAYANTAKLGLNAAGIAAMRPVKAICFSTPYHLFDRIKIDIDLAGGIVEQVDYGADIRISMVLPVSNTEQFFTRLTELSSGTVVPRIAGEKYLPVRLDSNESHKMESI